MARMTLVLDNGAYSLKVGLASSAEPKVLPNCITRSVFVHVTGKTHAGKCLQP